MSEQEWLTVSAATVEEAELIGLARLGALREEVEIEVLDEGKKGFLGLGGRAAKIRMRRVVPLVSSAVPAMGRVDVTAASEEAAPVSPEAQPALAAPEPVVVETAVTAPEPTPVSPVSAAETTQERRPGMQATGRQEKSAGTQAAGRAPKPTSGEPKARREKKAGRPKASRKPQDAVRKAPQGDETAAQGELGVAVATAQPTTVEGAPETAAFILEEAKKLLAGFKVQLSLRPDRDEPGVVVLDIRGRDARSLVGRDAHVMESVQHLLRLLVQRRMPGAPEVVVDADGYWERHDRKLRLLAQRTAEQVVQTGRPVRMRPMPARDRRVIHVTLRNDPRVSTESQGSGAQRAVVVMPRREG